LVVLYLHSTSNHNYVAR